MAEIIDTTIIISDGETSAGLTADGYDIIEIDVLNGGTLTDSLATNGGYIVVDEGGTVERTSATAYGDVFVDGNATELTAEDGGMFDINLGTLDTGRVKKDGMGAVYTGGTADKITVEEGGALLNYGGTVRDTVVLAGGTFTAQYVNKDNTPGTSDTTVNEGAEMYINHNAIVTGTTVYGKLEIDDGTAYGTTVTGGTVIVSSGGSADDTLLEAGLFEIFSGTATKTVITGGTMRVNAGNSISDTTLGGGELKVSKATAETTVLNGGVMQVISDSTIFGTTVNGGLFTMDTGTITDTTILGGTASFTGVAITNLEVGTDGTFTIDSGSTLGGFAVFASGASITINGTIAFDTALATSKNAQVTGLSAVTGGTTYTLTDAAATKGAYLLATDAAAFNSEVKFGDYTLKVWESVPVGELYYTLRITRKNNLALVISDSPVPANLVNGDRDANGVSDVMFVWDQYNYAHGYWMNGSSDWWSADAAFVDPTWDNLGSYDMNMDFKADAVMCGNVEKGAYIGFYNAGNDVDGWTNIGYLINEDGIDWSMKVGNLTGNFGANSIVLYAPELYSLGAWIDGTDTWAGISTEFGGSDWTLAGCGDFDGDERDDVLMLYKGSVFYSADMDGNVAALGNSIWCNCEVGAIGDFSGDGKDDIVLYEKATGGMYMLLDGISDNYAVIGQLDADDWYVVGAGDYNGDRKDDLLVRQNSTGMLLYYVGADFTKWNVGYEVDTQWTAIA